MKKCVGFLLTGVFMLVGLVIPKVATAGFLDRLNQATQAVQQIQSAGQTAGQVGSALKKGSSSTKSQSGSQKKFPLTKTSNPIKGTWGNQVTCEGPNSATCANGMDNMVNCMHQGKGYYYRLVAANLQEKLDNGQNLTDEQRTHLGEDISAVQEAIDTDKVVDADPQDPQRWFSWLSAEDQQQINQTNSKYMKEVHDDCDSRFGGMSQYSSGN